MYNMTLCFLWVYMRKYLVHVLLTLMSVEKNPQFSQESREIKHLKLWRCKNELISCQRRSIPRDQYIIGIAYTLKQEIQKLNMTESRIKSDINHPAWSLTEILPIMHWPEQAVLGWTVDQCIPLLCPSDLSPGATFAGQLRTSDQHSLNRSQDWLVTEARGHCEHACKCFLIKPI